MDSLIYPTKTITFDVDDAFGIFIGFQIEVWLLADIILIYKIKKQVS